jgi:hypothetical protein
MEREDYQWIILALGILLVVGLIIKPALTNEQPNYQLPEFPSLPPLRLPTPFPTVTTRPVTTIPTEPVITVGTTNTVSPAIPTTTTEPSPATNPNWNGSTETVVFVDPSTYNVNLTTFVPRHNELIPQFSNQSANQTPFRTANFTSKYTINGQYSGTTGVMDIPYPYWELWYTVEPAMSDLSAPSEGAGSYSTVKPAFSIDVVDANNPSAFVKTIIPPGTLDLSLWKDNDPRPWKEKFYEGNNQYYFIIKASMLTSYSIDVKIPNNYLDKI